LGEVAAELDEAGAEVLVEDVEVIAADTALGLGEIEAHRAGLRGAVVRGDDPLDLLGGDDRLDAGFARLLEARPDVVELAVVPAAAVLRRRMGMERNWAKSRRPRGSGCPCARMNRGCPGDRRGTDDLTGDLEVGNVGVEVDAVEAIEVEDDVSVEDVVDVDCLSHGCHSKQ
jgi:hypothetical protein